MPVPATPFRRIFALAAGVLALASGTATARDRMPAEVIVRYGAGTQPAGVARAADQVVDVRGSSPTGGPARVLELAPGASVATAVERLRDTPGVAYAAPNPIARVSAAPRRGARPTAVFDPNDPGKGKGWEALQWNLLPAAGIDAPTAWNNLIAAGRPGGRGVVVAVLDTGVAYRDRGRFKRSPDLRSTSFTAPFDFVDNDPFPLDTYGHGTHVASTIAEDTNNGYGLTGVAYGATIMPVRVLDDEGLGDAGTIARGIRYAARRGADVINLSLEFSAFVRAADIPDILAAVRFARSRGVLVVGAAGNDQRKKVAYPARAGGVLSVGATTENRCLSDFSNVGAGLDIVAPGGGPDADIPDDPACRPFDPPGRPIFQVTLTNRGASSFGVPSSYEGTSMASPHVSATAALVIASGVLGANPSPAEVEERLEATADDLGAEGYDNRYGAGLLNAGRATAPR